VSARESLARHAVKSVWKPRDQLRRAKKRSCSCTTSCWSCVAPSGRSRRSRQPIRRRQSRRSSTTPSGRRALRPPRGENVFLQGVAANQRRFRRFLALLPLAADACRSVARASSSRAAVPSPMACGRRPEQFTSRTAVPPSVTPARTTPNRAESRSGASPWWMHSRRGARSSPRSGRRPRDRRGWVTGTLFPPGTSKHLPPEPPSAGADNGRPQPAPPAPGAGW
jgi:hypothetical protein